MATSLFPLMGENSCTRISFSFQIVLFVAWIIKNQGGFPANLLLCHHQVLLYWTIGVMPASLEI
ncbi:hypothetical protein CW304_22130 [Bacillus sp. UFRGS-B20]|nr:hypothetical protein CW304_22130 [Bacillus sp. UFRGS-B20]